MEVMEFIIEKLSDYVLSLDWTYMITLMMICFGIERQMVKDKLKQWTKVSVKRRYRVSFVGGLYGAVVYLLRDYGIGSIERLFQSFVFVQVFYKLLLEEIMEFVQRRVFGKKAVVKKKEEGEEKEE